MLPKGDQSYMRLDDIRTNYTRYHNSLLAMSRSRQERDLARSNVLVGGFGSSVEATEVDAVDAATTKEHQKLT